MVARAAITTIAGRNMRNTAPQTAEYGTLSTSRFCYCAPRRMRPHLISNPLYILEGPMVVSDTFRPEKSAPQFGKSQSISVQERGGYSFDRPKEWLRRDA